MRRLILLVLSACCFAQVIPGPPVVAPNPPTSTIIGNLQTATGGVVTNGTLTFSLSQPSVVSGTSSVSANTVSCYTSTAGNVVGVPDPLATPILSTNTASGTLPAGTYFVKFVYVGPGGTASVPSPEASIVLTAQGTVNVAAPAFQPVAATGFFAVYIGTAHNTETLQGAVTSWTTFSQSTPLTVPAGALPSSNNTACSVWFSDSLIPTGTYYTVSLTNKNGSLIAGFPQTWCTFGGAGGTINVSQGAPTGNCGNNGVFYPTPIMAVPQNNAAQSISGPLTVTGLFTASAGANVLSLNNILFADQFPGADACAQINNAMLALPNPGGGVIDARGIIGYQGCASNPWAGITNGNIQLLLGNACYVSTAEWITPNSQGNSITGIARGDPNSNCTGTVILASGSMANTPLIRLGTGAASIFGARISNLTVDCQAKTGMTGIYSTDIQELSEISFVNVSNCVTAGIDIESLSPGFAQHYSIHDAEIYENSFSLAGTIGLKIGGQVSSNCGPSSQRFQVSEIRNVTVNAAGGTPMNAAVDLSGIQAGYISDLHLENAVDGVLIGDLNCSQSLVLVNTSGLSSVTNTIHVNGTAGNGALTLINTTQGTGTNTIKDDVGAQTITAPFVPFYVVGGAGSSSYFGNALNLIVGGFLGTFTHANSANRTYTFPNNTGTLAETNFAQTWTADQTTMGLISPTIKTGVAQGSGFKHQRFVGNLGGTCPTAAAIGAACTSANLNWTSAFADNNYTVTCTLIGPMTAQPHIVNATLQAAGAGITLTIAADTAVAANVAPTGTVDCVAAHD